MLELSKSMSDSSRRRSTFYVSLTDTDSPHTPPAPQRRQRRTRNRALAALFKSPDVTNSPVSDDSNYEYTPGKRAQIHRALQILDGAKKSVSKSFDSSLGGSGSCVSLDTSPPCSNRSAFLENKCITLPSGLSANACLEEGRKEITLWPLDPPRSRLAGFIRRTHSTKLTRSPSLLRTLASSCVEQRLDFSPNVFINPPDEDSAVLSGNYQRFMFRHAHCSFFTTNYYCHFLFASCLRANLPRTL